MMTTMCQVCCQLNDGGSPVDLPWLPAVWLLLCHCCILRRFLARQEKAQHEQALAKLERQKREGKKNQRLGLASFFLVSAAAWGGFRCVVHVATCHHLASKIGGLRSTYTFLGVPYDE